MKQKLSIAYSADEEIRAVLLHAMLLAFHSLPVLFIYFVVTREFQNWNINNSLFLYYVYSFNFKMFHFDLNPHFLQPYRLNSTFKWFWYHHPCWIPIFYSKLLILDWLIDWAILFRRYIVFIEWSVGWL